MSIASVSAAPTAGITQQLQNQAQAQAVQSAATVRAGSAEQTAAAAQITATQQTGHAHHHHHAGGTPPAQPGSAAQSGTSQSSVLNTIA